MSIANVSLKQLKLDTRQIKAFEIVSDSGHIMDLGDGEYSVKSQSGNKNYHVKNEWSAWSCDCPDYSNRKISCKHIYAAKLFRARRER